MAVIRHSIIFGGIDSADFGIYIGGEGTFNAPERDVEMISIPGRDGAFALDKGRFENIEVKYTVINQEPDLATFSANLEGFRNALCSQRGYQRLEDTFHPDEYRMAVFADKFEVKPIEYNTAAKFDIVFNCKPQRYLKEGETAVSVSSGDTLTNPTLFEAHPVLEVEGYGDINLNGREIKVIKTVLGNIRLKKKSRSTGLAKSYTFDASLVDLGDEITISGYPYSSPPKCSVYVDIDFLLAKNAGAYGYSTTGTNTSYVQCMTAGDGTNRFASALYKLAPIAFTVGTPDSFTATFQSSFSTSKGSRIGTASVTSSAVVAYDGNNRIDVTVTRSITTDTLNVLSLMDAHDFFIVCTTTANSSVSTLGHPTYIDCDIGEAYKIEGNSLVSLNKSIDLGSRLPELSPGDNEVTFDNTITDLKVVPNWWKV